MMIGHEVRVAVKWDSDFLPHILIKSRRRSLEERLEILKAAANPGF
jgi:hypothetical protein